MSTVRFVLPPSWPTLAAADLTDLSCEADTVGQALAWLVEQHPVFRERICLRDTAQIAPWTIVCLDHIHIIDPTAPIHTDASEIQIIPALVGG